MRSFRKYLKEEQENYPNFCVCYNFGSSDVDTDYFEGDGDDNPIRVFEKTIGIEVANRLGIDDAEANFNYDDYIQIEIPLKNSAQASETSLRNLEPKITKIVSGFLNATIEAQDHAVWVREQMPIGLKVEFVNVLYNLEYSNITSLAGIDKQVVCCDLLFKNAEKIKSNVLGIFKIKNIQRVSSVDMISKNAEWYKIVRNCLRDKEDFLDCQEALISAGLKDYAKF